MHDGPRGRRHARLHRPVDNVTSLPGGQIAASGLVTSAQEETSPFVQAVTGGTGAYQRVHGQLTVDEAGPQPATLTFHLS